MEGDELPDHPVFKDWGIGGQTVVPREQYFALIQGLGLDPTTTLSVRLTPQSIEAEVLIMSAHDGPKTAFRRVQVR